jgi:hypothetical protein
LTRQINAIQMQLLDLAKTKALAATRHIDLETSQPVNQPIGQHEIAQDLHALTIREAPATTSHSLLNLGETSVRPGTCDRSAGHRSVAIVVIVLPMLGPVIDPAVIR